MNKITKRMVAALVGAATLVGGLGLAASANAANSAVKDADLQKDQTIEVDAPSDANISGSTFKAVELAKYIHATTDGTNITSYDVNTVPALSASIVNALKNIKDSKGNAANPDASNPMVWVVNNLYQPNSTPSPWQGSLRDFLDNLKEQDAFKNAKGVDMPVTGSTASASVEPGIYAIVDTTTKGQAAIIALNGTGINDMKKLVANNKTFDLGTVEYKANSKNGEAVAIDSKTITKVQDTNVGKVAEDGKTAENSIGKTETFEVKTKVPNWTGYDKFYLAVNDTPSKGLTLDKDSVNVVIKGLSPFGRPMMNRLTPGAEYQVTTDADNKTKIIFGTSGNLLNLSKLMVPVGATIDIHYIMKVNNLALNAAPQTNAAEIEYSDNPNNWEDHKTSDPATTTTHTGKISFQKTDVNGAALTGAQFQLYEQGSATPVNVVKTADGVYRLSDGSDGTNAATTMDTNSTTNKGHLTIDGLDGKYELRESKAPAGYNTPVKADVKFTVNAPAGTASYNGLGEDNALAVPGSDADTIRVINARNLLEMPKTGMAGIITYVTLALVLLGAGVAALAIHRHHVKANARD